jgi:hypothetical protein
MPGRVGHYDLTAIWVEQRKDDLDPAATPGGAGLCAPSFFKDVSIFSPFA